MRRPSSSVTRYLLARLRPLGRPMFWGPSIVLLFMVLFAWDFFSRPELLSYFGLTAPETDNSLSADDRAIGADIDSLPLLMNDIGIKSKAEFLQTEAPQALTANRSTTSSANNSGSQSAQSQSNAGLYTGSGDDLTTQADATSTTQTSTIANSVTLATPLPQSPLQAAVSQLASENRSTQTVQTPVPIEGTTRLDTPTRSTTNSYTAIVEGNQPIPKAAGFPGTVAPPMIAPSPASLPTVSPVQPTDLRMPSSQEGVQSPETPQPNQQPFTTPRSIPGRYIGGGKINTFSNP